MARNALTPSERFIVDSCTHASADAVLGQDDLEVVFRPVLRVRVNLNEQPRTGAHDKTAYEDMAKLLRNCAKYFEEKALAAVGT